MVVDAVVRHWESLVAEWAGGVSRNDNCDMAQTAGRKILERDNGRRRAEEGNASLTLKVVLFYAEEGLVDPT